jgi:hypothetical protein
MQGVRCSDRPHGDSPRSETGIGAATVACGTARGERDVLGEVLDYGNRCTSALPAVELGEWLIDW